MYIDHTEIFCDVAKVVD